MTEFKINWNGRIDNSIIINKLATRIYDIDPYEAQDADETPETIADKIRNDPLTVISFLVDMVENLQA